jgi:hypothetical protein
MSQEQVEVEIKNEMQQLQMIAQQNATSWSTESTNGTTNATSS